MKDALLYHEMAPKHEENCNSLSADITPENGDESDRWFLFFSRF